SISLDSTLDVRAGISAACFLLSAVLVGKAGVRSKPVPSTNRSKPQAIEARRITRTLAATIQRFERTRDWGVCISIAANNTSRTPRETRGCYHVTGGPTTTLIGIGTPRQNVDFLSRRRAC